MSRYRNFIGKKNIYTDISKMSNQQSGGRKFYESFKYKSEEVLSTNELKDDSNDIPNFMFSLIRRNIIGADTQFQGAFGKRKVIYCDYTASGRLICVYELSVYEDPQQLVNSLELKQQELGYRSLKFIEDYIRDNVLPHYGNTHTTTSVTSLQTTMFRQEARDIIRQAVNASENNAVIFTGTGCTGAVHKLIHALNLQAPPIVFVSPYEHHSNLLPWKEIGSKIVWVEETSDGSFDYEHLETVMQKLQNTGRALLGCFAAASNVTGILLDADRIAHIVHKYNGLVFFDYATAGPYVDVNMNPTLKEKGLHNVYKDAVFISTHKFVGGPGSPGILVARKNLFGNPVPSNGGGGSVFFVTENHHRYLKEIEMREEGGTPDITGSIRAGLVFQLKDKVGCDSIHEKDQDILTTAYKAWKSVPNLILLGPTSSRNKLPIFSFLIKHPESQRFLHHNFVAVLLNDLFGIQSRGGCACAGPYAQKLLGMTEDIALQIEDLLLEDQRLDRHHLRRYREYSDKEILRPGFTRLNLPYFFTEDEISFVIKAVALISENGWKLLPQYLFNPETGEWNHKDHKVYKDRKWLGSIKYDKDGMKFPKSNGVKTTQMSIEEILSEAERIISNAEKQSYRCGDQTLLFGEKGEQLRWFLLPCEAQDYLKGLLPGSCQNFTMPFFPNKLIETSSNKKHLNGDSTENLRDRQHYCTCSPYKRSQYSSIGPLMQNGIDANDKNLCKETSAPTPVSGDYSGNHTLQIETKSHTVTPQDSLEASSLNTEPSKDDTRSGDNVCSLLCKPVASRSPNTTVEESVVAGVKFHNPPKSIFTSAVEGIEEFKMIKDGDRVLLCLSGGKDSLSMLHIINQYKYYVRNKGVHFEFGAMTVDPQSAGYDPSPLIGYMKALCVPYFYEEQDIIAAASNLAVCESICSFCSRMKRGRIYKCARREKYNVIALGQHLDDMAESFLMSTFHNGYLRSMKANYTVTEGDLRVIRPLVFVREKNLRSFAEKVHLPVIPENCPACFEAPKERHRMKQLLAQQEVLFPNLFQSLRSALLPLISKDKTGLEKRIVDEEIDA